MFMRIQKFKWHVIYDLSREQMNTHSVGEKNNCRSLNRDVTETLAVSGIDALLDKEGVYLKRESMLRP